ncbi:relaxase/mobilization nuclease domain-containing protein [Pedobacter sp. SYSU D00535]|uniref:relaxase/mobilization nuclease domain-containing protein n=1 Tax=Pedobacter sp. SYSU D00535 TaxID=2810308 RepID=UPI001A978686|nr:relaxase/mobilization nuclease domain-containing protein [Pedobacter sp. SYSU D00535]
MIVKILGSSADFSGVKYNTRKIERDKGELIKAVNFGPLEGMANLRPQDYINYFRSIASLNTRVRSPQFHAVISCKGRTNSREELAEIADKWLKGMGYGENPYMLIFHKDTANNHIHMVSTRVGLDGKKVSDSHERLKAYRVLGEINGTDLKTKVEKDIAESLSYHFSTLAQWKLILEGKGYSIQAEKDHFKVFRSAGEEGQVKLSQVNQRIAEREKDTGRIMQIRALIHKYQDRFDNPNALAEFISTRFFLETIFHGTPAYGYTIIDHKGKQVFKGSEIVSLAEFTDSPSAAKNVSNPEQLPTDTWPIEAESPLLENRNGEITRIPLYSGLNISIDQDDEALNAKRRRGKLGRNRL